MAATWEQRWTQLIAGYNATVLSPCLQLAASYTHTAGEEILLDPENRAQAYGITIRLAKRRPTFVNTQYTCHTSHGVYRILLGLGYILKTDYKFNLMSVGGLQNTLTMQGVILTCAATDMLVRNDLPLRLWTGVERADAPGLTQGIQELVGQTTFRYVRGRDLSSHFARVDVNPAAPAWVKLDAAIAVRTGTPLISISFMNCVPIPVPLWLQWTRKVNSDPQVTVEVDYGIIATAWEAQHIVTGHETSVAQPIIAATFSTRKRTPISFVAYGAAGNFPVMPTVDNWQCMTSQHMDPDVNKGPFMSNVICMSAKYHYFNTRNVGIFLTINDLAISTRPAVDTIDTSQLMYPDSRPAIKEFFRRRRAPGCDFREWWGGDAITEAGIKGEGTTSKDPHRPASHGQPSGEIDIGNRPQRRKVLRTNRKIRRHTHLTRYPRRCGRTCFSWIMGRYHPTRHS